MARHKCRYAFCANQYDAVIGGCWNDRGGAVCVPCLYTEQMVAHGQTIEEVERVSHLMRMFTELLGKTGWTWQDVKDSYQRMAAHRSEFPEVQQ